MSSQVAIITGAASGIGLALTRDLVSKGWKVTMADVNQQTGEQLASELGPSVIFHKTDVSDWDQLAALFKKTWTMWGQIDFYAANAGIDDRESLYGATTLEGSDEPVKPDLATIEVDFVSVIYSMRLAIHYFRKNAVKGGKIVVTSSSGGLYPVPFIPQYSACKHGLVGLTRAMAQPLKTENITINAVLPAFVVTNLAPGPLNSIWPKEHTTPMSTILKAFNLYLDTDKTGHIGECSLEEIYFRTQPEYPNESQRWVVEESGGLWAQGYPDPLKSES